MHVTIQQERLAASSAEIEIHLTNGIGAVSLQVSRAGTDYGRFATLTPQDAEALAYDLLCKAYNVRHKIHDNSEEARGMYAEKLDLTETEALIGLGFHEGAGE